MEKKIKSQEVMIVFKDNIDWLFNSVDTLKTSLKTGAITLLVFLTISFFRGFSLNLNETIYALIGSLVVIALTLILTPIWIAFCHFRMKPEQLKVNWFFDESELMLADGAKNKIITPWEQVKAMSFKKKGVVIYYKPMGSRWMPARLFQEIDILNLKELSTEKITG
ncbi:hypothetical protein [Litorimonas sp. WD9-15]|uniref:hypothetical protein n=1 Tax=Litorimonas sp. WD9-15 TaxID=3418716 RepID=UPI003CFE851D